MRSGRIIATGEPGSTYSISQLSLTLPSHVPDIHSERRDDDFATRTGNGWVRAVIANRHLQSLRTHLEFGTPATKQQAACSRALARFSRVHFEGRAACLARTIHDDSHT